MATARKPPYECMLTADGVCYICDKPVSCDDVAYATGRGGSLRIYCSEECADPRPCADCPHPKRQHNQRGCVAPVVDREGYEDVCSCRAPRL